MKLDIYYRFEVPENPNENQLNVIQDLNKALVELIPEGEIDPSQLAEFQEKALEIITAAAKKYLNAADQTKLSEITTSKITISKRTVAVILLLAAAVAITAAVTHAVDDQPSSNSTLPSSSNSTLPSSSSPLPSPTPSTLVATIL